MIQQINESEKSRIRNLHRKHFILNENKGDYPDIPGFEKGMTSLGVLTYTKDLGGGDKITLQYSDSQGFDIDGGSKPIRNLKILHNELSKHGDVEVEGLGAALVVPEVRNITKLLNAIKPLLTKIYR